MRNRAGRFAVPLSHLVSSGNPLFEAAGGFPPYRAAEDLMFLDRIRDRGMDRGLCARRRLPTGRWPPAGGPHFRRFTAVLLSQPGCRPWTILAPGRGPLVCARGAVRDSRVVSRRIAWLAVPLAGAGARIALTIWRKRKENWGSSFNPLRWIGVGLVLMTLDAATFAGRSLVGLGQTSRTLAAVHRLMPTKPLRKKRLHDRTVYLLSEHS